jgi:DNA-binding LacI/PurR family transcriptional regulator
VSSFAARALVDRITLRDVARVARVSPSTVSLYVRGQPGVSRAMQDRIAAAIAELGYAPRARARANHNRLVGLAVEKLPLPVFSDIFYAEVIQGIEERAKALGLSVIFSVVEGQDLSQVMANQQAEGWLLLGGGNITDDQILAAQQTGVPIVLLDNYVRGAELDCVLPDNVRGGYAAFRHLLDLGHRRIAIITGPDKYKTLGDRLAGALIAAAEAGLSREELIVQPSLSSGQPRKGYLEMQALLALPRPPTAVFAVSDKTAFGALAALRDAGWRVPDDLSLVGFDDLLESSQTAPPLTTVHVPKRELGLIALQRLADRLEGRALPPAQTLIYTHLVRRDSTATCHS